MANKTVDQTSIHGTDPQNLIEKIVRSRIYASRYWNEECFGLNAETLVDKAIALNEVGGTYGGNKKASKFLCLILKMLQLNPEKEIIIEFIKNDDHRYLRCLGAFYLRLIGSHVDIYQYLEPFYADYRRIRRRLPEGKLVWTYVDAFIDELLHSERVCDVILPHLLARRVLEATDELKPRISILEEELELMADEEESSSSSDRTKRRRRDRSHSGSVSDSSEDSSEKKARERRRKSKFEKQLISTREANARNEKSGPLQDKGQSSATGDSMSLDETNALRAKLGLKPLK